MKKNMLVIDGLQYVNWNRAAFAEARQSGIHAIHVTIAYWENIRETLENIGRWHRHFIAHSDLIMPVRQASDILEARRMRKVGIIFGFQNCSPIEDDVRMVQILHELGVRIMQLSYNNQSLLASGCYEDSDAGITRFGKQVIKEMNRVGMVIDMSHSGERSTLEAIELSARPIAITHANPASFHPALRNKSDEVLRAIGGSGGMLGFSMYPFHLKNGPDCSLQEFCAMIATTVDMMGIDHVGIGSDLCKNWDYSTLEWMRSGRWTNSVDHGEGSAAEPAWPRQPGWFESSKDMMNLAEGMAAAGFGDDEIARIMGGNWLSFFENRSAPALLHWRPHNNSSHRACAMNDSANTIRESLSGIEPRPTSSSIDWPVFILSGGFITLFVMMALIDIELLSALVNTAYSKSTALFGAYWQILLLATFLIGLAVAVSRCGQVRLGNQDAPDIKTFKWIAIIMCTLLAGGGVFWAGAEPMAHFTAAPPLFGVEDNSAQAVYPALAQSYMHWGFLAWAILGSLTAIVLMYLHYQKDLPLKPRTLLYPVFGDKVMHGWFGAAVDAACVVAVVSGTVGPIGFLGLQVSFGLSELFAIDNNYSTQLAIIVGLIALYTVSAVSGVTRGIQLLSTFNVGLSLALIAYILILGPTAFIFDSFIQSFGLYLNKFIPMATFRADLTWVNQWTVFFWGWFLGYGPLMAMFICRISRGRTIRELIVVISLVAPVVTCFWFTIVGGSGIAFELASPGVISEPYKNFDLPAALLATTQQLPLGFLISLLFLILTTIFVATTGDSMTYTVSMVMTGTDDPPAILRVFWGVMMGVVAAILISIGSGGVSALQSFIVVTAVPVSLILLASLWHGPKIARVMAAEQGIL